MIAAVVGERSGDGGVRQVCVRSLGDEVKGRVSLSEPALAC